MTQRTTHTFLAFMLAAATSARGQASTPKIPEPRPVAPALATSREVFGSIAAVRQLPGGRVLVNDQANRRIVLLDSALALLDVVIDTTGTRTPYGARGGGLMPYHGDSTLFVDPSSLSMLVLDPTPRVVRVLAIPSPKDAIFLTGGTRGFAGLDARGRLVHRTDSYSCGSGPGRPEIPPPPPDSAALLRFDFSSRIFDTAGFFHIPKTGIHVEKDAEGGTRMSSLINPLPMVDEWAVMSDGTVAFVRGQDYHIDFVGPDGAPTSGEKIPFNWIRFTDEEKTALIDSTRAARDNARQVGGASTSIGEGAAAPSRIPVYFVPLNYMPEYRPVFTAGGVRADEDAHIWVRTLPVRPDGAIYDVIDRRGQRVDRVRVPPGTTVAGFGRGGVVYLGMRDAAGIHLVRTRVTTQ